ncbi:MAG: NADH-quinone oxidoreductase subunit NuoE [Chitinispirillaceae bacterium]|nr:NADH-quinone oxidoreductase subunit NuoE [Chitinispirillaceae bacterium]
MKEKTLQLLEEKYPGAERDALIPVLQDIQELFGYLPKEALKTVSDQMRIPLSKIYGVASFYNQFRFQPIGKYHILLCRGTACHVKGSEKVLTALEKELKIKAGETTKDNLFTLDVVACLGACGLAPVISINGEFYAAMTPDKAVELIKEIRIANEKK